MSTLPHQNDSIGVFDSGLGGLTVLNALCKHLPQENFIYLADTARIPYGNKPTSTLTRFAEECCRFLEQKQVKLIVIACHSISSVALDYIRSKFKLPIIGMIEPSVEQIRSLTESQKLVVLGTRRTIDAGTYEKMFSREKSISSVHPLPCPLFVPLVEEGHISDSMCDLVVGNTLSSLKELDPTSLFLGCTHFPFLIESIKKIVPKAKILDPAECVATSVQSLLKEQNLENRSGLKGSTQFFVTDDPSRFSTFKSQLLNFESQPAKMAILS
jgi:glutamate racemase